MKLNLKNFLAASVFVLALSGANAGDYTRIINANLPKVQVMGDATFNMVAEEITDKTLTFIPADDEGFYYTSRVDFSDPAAPRLIWEGTTVSFNFTGTRLGLRFKNSNSSLSYYNVIIDGEIALLNMEPYGEYDYFINKKLSKGEHSCVIFKRNEAGVYDSFLGVDVDAKGYKKASGAITKPELLPRKIEFYGDSITAGVCVETEGEDSYASDQMVTHNAYAAYPAIAARKLGWELSDIAVGGTGISVSWNSFIMPKHWKNMDLSANSKEYDFSTGRTPDVVVVNLGQNDFGLPASNGTAFPKDFEENYLSLLKQIRQQYPESWIISATGGMSAIKDSKQLQTGISNAVKRMEDEKILQFTYRAFTYNHPRVDTHIKMADQLVNFINQNVVFE